MPIPLQPSPLSPLPSQTEHFNTLGSPPKQPLQMHIAPRNPSLPVPRSVSGPNPNSPSREAGATGTAVSGDLIKTAAQSSADDAQQEGTPGSTDITHIASLNQWLQAASGAETPSDQQRQRGREGSLFSGDSSVGSPERKFGPRGGGEARVGEAPSPVGGAVGAVGTVSVAAATDGGSEGGSGLMEVGSVMDAVTVGEGAGAFDARYHEDEHSEYSSSSDDGNEEGEDAGGGGGRSNADDSEEVSGEGAGREGGRGPGAPSPVSSLALSQLTDSTGSGRYSSGRVWGDVLCRKKVVHTLGRPARLAHVSLSRHAWCYRPRAHQPCCF
jgi:hypothetical protein